MSIIAMMYAIHHMCNYQSMLISPDQALHMCWLYTVSQSLPPPSSYTHIIVLHQSISGQFIDEPVDFAGVVYQSAVKVKPVDVGVFEGELTVGEHSMRVGLTAHKVICTECMVLVLMLMYTQ